MPKIERVQAVIDALKRKLKARLGASTKCGCVVGYTQNYALPVHEILDAVHQVGQAKFLEQPLRENASTYAAIVTRAARSGLSLPKALLLAGLALQRDSQELVPVDTGALKNSAFTRLEEGVSGERVG